MASLTETAIIARKTIRYTIYFIIAVVVARFLFGVGVNLFNSLFPAGPPPPTVGYGRLPPLPFPEVTRELPEITYSIETPDGGLPGVPEQARVFFMPRNSVDLFTEDRAISQAAALGYTAPPLELSQTLFRFNHPVAPATLQMNIVSGVYSTSYNLAFDPSPLQTITPAPSAATAAAQTYFGTPRPFPEDLAGEIQTEFLRVEGQNLVSAISLSEADFVKVNFYRTPIDEIPAVTADPNESNIWAIVSGADSPGNIIASEFKYYEIDQTQWHTYPLKNATTALEDLLSGSGHVADLGLNVDGEVTIRRVFIAYYDPGVQYGFYQPVFVFEGDDGFVAYVPAITSEFYGE